MDSDATATATGAAATQITPNADSANRSAYLQQHRAQSGQAPSTAAGSSNDDESKNDMNNDDFKNAGQTAALSAHDAEQEAATIEAIAARIPRLRDPNDPLNLTPLRSHYLKKTLVKLEIEKEIQILSRQDALSLLGPPFRPSRHTQNASLPFVRFLFHHFVLTFPFLRSAPPNFFADKVQIFIDRFTERNISGTDDRDETTKRRQLGARFTKWFVLLLGAAIHVKGGDGAEEILRVADADRTKLFVADNRRLRKGSTDQHDTEFEVNVVGVRTRKTRGGRLHRGKLHDEFIIRTRHTDGRETFVSRRYGDFARLADTLRLEFPEEEIPRPPAKDRRETDVKSPRRTAESSFDDGSDVQDVHTPQMDRLRLDAQSSPSSSQFAFASHDNGGRDPNSDSPTAGPLAREKNRLTLRAYLRSLLSNVHVADCETFSSFLLSEPIVLTPAEERDLNAREALDAVRDDETKRFNEEANRRVAELRHHLQSFKADLIQPDGLTRIFATIKSTPNIDDLPESFRALFAWGRISLASTLFHLFVGGDTASDLFGQMKRIHGLMPYFVLRGILRISNPVAMIRGVLDLFLAQPFGQRSLAQRMLTSNIQEEARELGEMANRVAEKVEDNLMCERVRCFVYAPLELQQALRQESERDRLDIVTVILKTDKLPGHATNVSPPLPLSRGQIHRVVRSSRAYERYKEYRDTLRKNEQDEGPDAVDADAWLYEDLHVLLKCLTRLRDKEQLITLLFEGVTSELLKDIVTIFYSPLAQVYKAANIADSLSDLQAFINDLIRTVEANEQQSYTNPQTTVQVFIDLVARHEARFYHFVHQVHSKGAGLFDGLMHWIELFVNFVRGPDPNVDESKSKSQRRGIGEVDLEICLPAGEQQRKRVLHEIDCVVVHAYRLKLLRELKLKRRLADQEVRGAANRAGSQDAHGGFGISSSVDDDAFVNALVENLGMSDALTDEVDELEAEEEAEAEAEGEEEEDGQDDFSDAPEFDEDVYASSIDGSGASDAGRSPLASPPLPPKKTWVPPKPQRSISTLTATAANKQLPPVPIIDADDAHAQVTRQRRRRRIPQAPRLEYVPEMLPLFVEMVRPMLRPARTASASSLRAPISPTEENASQQHQQQQQQRQSHTDDHVPGGWIG